MKNFYYLFIPVLFLCSCPDDVPESFAQSETLENTFILNIELECDFSIDGIWQL